LLKNLTPNVKTARFQEKLIKQQGTTSQQPQQPYKSCCGCINVVMVV
jgi:hypothetical protein